jgi:hypothetical protein
MFRINGNKYSNSVNMYTSKVNYAYPGRNIKMGKCWILESNITTLKVSNVSGGSKIK